MNIIYKRENIIICSVTVPNHQFRMMGISIMSGKEMAISRYNMNLLLTINRLLRYSMSCSAYDFIIGGLNAMAMLLVKAVRAL